MAFELKYFDIPGRGEAIRILLNGTSKEFIDSRIKFQEWGSIKATTPLGSVPILSMDGGATYFTQSTSLKRYAAKLVDMYPTDPLQALIVDEMMDTLNELNSKTPMDKNPDALKVKRQEFRDTTMKQYLTFVESRIQQYGVNDTKTVCGIPSVADIDLLVYHETLASGFLDHIDISVFNDYPGILNVIQEIKKHPIVTSYYAVSQK